MGKWNTGIAVVALGLSVVLGLSAALVPTAPATAASAAPAPVTDESTPTCGEDIKQDAARLAAAGKSGMATCVRKTVKQIDLATGDLSVNADVCGGSSTRTRIGACIVEDAILVIYRVPNGEVVGTITYTVSGLTTLNHNSLTWTQSFNYRAGSVTGQGAGPAVLNTYIYAEPLCLNSCFVSSSSLIGGLALPGYAQSGSANFYSPPSGYIWYPQSAWKWWFYNALWQPTTSNTLTTTPGTHRCDSALGGLPSGCVYHAMRPTLDIPSGRYPGYARHIGLAINYYNMPSVLTRTQNESLRALNYSTACPGNQPRPPGMSCDEYPFQSTYQGAYSQPYGRRMFIFNFTTGYLYDCQTTWLPVRVRTDSGGYSSCMIPAGENSLGGSDLGEFYYKSRVLDGDTFQVRVM